MLKTIIVLISGSYLGRIIGDKKFWISMGDMIDITMNPVSFEEYLGIFNLRELYNSLDFYGRSNKCGWEVIM